MKSALFCTTLFLSLPLLGGCAMSPRPAAASRPAAEKNPTPLHGESPQAIPTSLPYAAISNDGRYRVSYLPNPDPIPLNEPFSMDVVVSLAGSGLQPVAPGTTLSLDARMPAHQHGMNRQPTVRGSGAGNFVVRGMLLHMSGRWELYFDVTDGAVTERAQFALDLE